MEAFKRTMRGEVLDGTQPSDRANMWPPLTSMPENWPKLVCYPTDAFDIIECVKFARQQGLRVAIFYSGDRNASSLAQTLHGPVMLLVLERTMKAITIDGDIVSVEPGATGEELLEATTRLGFALPVPFCSREPLGAFLISGGAVGWGCQVLGPAASHVIAVDLVTPDGKLIRADSSSKDKSDLLWAARGAGYGFFGVPLRFHLRMAPLPTSIVAMSLRFPLDALADVTRWVESVHPALPRTVELTLRVGHALDHSSSSNGSVNNNVPPSPGFSPAPTPVVRTYSGEDAGKLPELSLPRASSLDAPLTPAKTPKTPSRRRSFRPVGECYVTAVAFEDDPGRADSALAPLLGCPVPKAHLTIPLGFEYAQLWELSDRFYPATLGCAATDNLWATVAPSSLAPRLQQRIHKAPSVLSSFLMLFHAPGRSAGSYLASSIGGATGAAACSNSNNSVDTSNANNSMDTSGDSPARANESGDMISPPPRVGPGAATPSPAPSPAAAAASSNNTTSNNILPTTGNHNNNNASHNTNSAARGALGLPGYSATYVGCYSFWAEECGALSNAGWLVDSARDLQPYAVGHYIGEASSNLSYRRISVGGGNTCLVCAEPVYPGQFPSGVGGAGRSESVTQQQQTDTRGQWLPWHSAAAGG
eukprot:jgi/Mesvir1/3483/Mv11974-RA.1